MMSWPVKCVCSLFMVMATIAAPPSSPSLDARPYIVTMNDVSVSGAYDAHAAVSRTTSTLSQTYPREMASIKHYYNRTMIGFSATLADAVVERLRENAYVHAIEPDGEVRALATLPWHLDRISQRRLPLDGVYNPAPERAGRPTVVYVVDTGVSPSHTEFKDASGVSRVIDGWNMLEDNVGWRDCNGHGTHCASGVAGRTCGVDPTAQIVSVRVLDCNGVGTYSDMIVCL